MGIRGVFGIVTRTFCPTALPGCECFSSKLVCLWMYMKGIG